MRYLLTIALCVAFLYRLGWTIAALTVKSRVPPPTAVSERLTLRRELGLQRQPF